MPKGHILINKDIYEAWKPDKKRAFHAFLAQGNVMDSTVVHLKGRPDMLLYSIDHPDFTHTADDSEYILKWEKRCNLDDWNYTDTITALFVRDGVKMTKVAEYSYD